MPTATTSTTTVLAAPFALPGGAALLITGNVTIDPRSIGEPRSLRRRRGQP